MNEKEYFESISRSVVVPIDEYNQLIADKALLEGIENIVHNSSLSSTTLFAIRSLLTNGKETNDDTI